MRRKMLSKAKLIVTVESVGAGHPIYTESVYDNRTKEYWSDEQIAERGIAEFLSVEDLKESLNWNLNGASSKYQFRWTMSCGTRSTGVAYVFD